MFVMVPSATCHTPKMLLPITFQVFVRSQIVLESALRVLDQVALHLQLNDVVGGGLQVHFNVTVNDQIQVLQVLDSRHQLLITNSDIISHGSVSTSVRFGVAVRYKGAAVSVRRLESDLQLWKTEIIHELLHTLGLKHCSNNQCVMQHSHSLCHVKIKSTKLCSGCVQLLRLKQHR